jgi:hypothetical protein
VTISGDQNLSSSAFVLDFSDLEIETGIDDISNLYTVQLENMQAYIGRKESEFSKSGDPDGIAESVLSFVRGAEAPRFFIHGSLLFAWSSYESIMGTLVDRIAKGSNPEVKIRPKDLKGDFLKRLRMYFDKVLHIDNAISKEDYHFLETFYSVRCALAHESGDMWLMKQKSIEKLKRTDPSGELFSFDHRYFVIKEKYASLAINKIQQNLRDIYTLYRNKYKDGRS